MRVIVAGATGFIGQALCRELCRDCEVVALSRDVRKAAGIVGEYASVVEWDARTASGWARQVEGAAAIVNLAGENLASGRWMPSKKDSILQSRTSSAGAVLDAVTGARKKPAVVMQASAVGYYGSRGDEELDETAGVGTGFLADVCRRVEAVAAKAETLGVRYVGLRSGVVLGCEGGILTRFIRPFRFYLGGSVGSGRQWLSWMDLRDTVRAIRFLMDNEDLSGAFNLTSPSPVTARQFSRVLGEVLGKPAWTLLPGLAARLIFGEMARETLLASQRVIPRRLLDAGFEFAHPDLQGALRTILQGQDNELS